MGYEKAAFMGQITAGVTHEFKNVLAIIKESAGLLEDLISLAKDGAPPSKEKCMRTLNRISEQVSRGVALSTNLNSFAHTCDEETTAIELNVAITQAAFLCARQARLKGMTLSALPYDKTLSVLTDPLAFQMLLFQCVDLLLGVAQSGSVIALRLEEGNGNRVIIAIQDQSSEPNGTSLQLTLEDAKWQTIETNAANLGMQVQAGSQPPHIAVGLSGE
jgi:C4-dicarboxylate-specific signal transduction histidine kinase